MINQKIIKECKEKYEGKEFYPGEVSLERDPDFEKFLTLQTTDEGKRLEALMLMDGKCKRPIDIVLKEVVEDEKETISLVIIDGYSRDLVCKKHNLPFKLNIVEHIDFEDKLACKEYMLQNQNGQRHMNKYRRCVAVLNMEKELVEKAKENQKLSRGRGKKGSAKSKNLFKKIDVHKEMAEKAGVSSNTINKVRGILQHASSEIKEQLASDKITINKAYNKIKHLIPKKKKNKSNSDNAASSDTGNEKVTSAVVNENNKVTVTDTSVVTTMAKQEEKEDTIIPEERNNTGAIDELGETEGNTAPADVEDSTGDQAEDTGHTAIEEVEEEEDDIYGDLSDYERGEILFQEEGKCEEALQYFEKVLSYAPGHIHALHFKGIILNELSYPDEALKCLNNAASELEELLLFVNLDRAEIILQLNRPEEARASLGKAELLFPEDSDLKAVSEKVEEALGNTEEEEQKQDSEKATEEYEDFQEEEAEEQETDEDIVEEELECEVESEPDESELEDESSDEELA